MRLISSIILVCMSFLSFGNIALQKPFKVIAFYSANWDVAHISYVHEANAWFGKMAEQHHFIYDTCSNWANLNPEFLADYQVLLLLDNVPPKEVRPAFEAYAKSNAGVMVFHVAAFNTDPQVWDWYYNEFLGSGAYAGNTWRATSAILHVENPNHPATKGLPERFESSPNEWYKWEKDLTINPDIDILMAIDPQSFPLGTGPKAFEIWHEGYYPVVWSNSKYHMLYINMGHNDMEYNPTRTVSYTFDNPTQNLFILNSLFWLAGRSK